MKDFAQRKRVLRQRLGAVLREIDAERLHEASIAAANCLTATDAFRQAESIMIFLPLRHEIDARPIALRAWQEGKTITAPLVGVAQKNIIPVEVRSFEEPMDEDRYGVMTPRGGRPFPVEMLDLVVVPGLGFDRDGHRLGRGCGYYDRFLAQPTMRAVTCGLAMDVQVVEQVPVGPYDVPMDMLVTDLELLEFNHRAVANHAG